MSDTITNMNNRNNTTVLKTTGNILWCLFGGIECAIGYFISAFVLICTIIGIPFGIQLWKIGCLCLWPFGSHVTTEEDDGCISFVFNVIWFFIGGFYVLIAHFLFGILWCVTIIGIPFAKQHFKLAGLALHPFGRNINM